MDMKAVHKRCMEYQNSEEGRTRLQSFKSGMGNKSMRTLEEHKVNPANDQITIQVLDEPGSGGACHEYLVTFSLSPDEGVKLSFQNGPIGEVGVNGITHEALLAILTDRLRAFQAGPYACRENALALTKIEEAQHWLHHRTKARMDRGVEGTHEK